MSISITLGALIGATMGGTEITPDLQARLDTAEARIAELAANQNADWMTEQRSEQIRGLVQDVLSDADTRASLQGDGATSGYNNGFFIQSADGKWSMTINGVFQERFTYLDATAGNWGFENTRTLLNFSGDIAGSAYYNMRLGWSPYDMSGDDGAGAAGSGQSANLQWAYGGFDLNDTMTLQLGSQKYDVQRSWIVNVEDQMMIERSLSTRSWNTSTVTNGVKLLVDQDNFRGNIMLSNASGVGTSTAYTANNEGWGVSLRGEFLMEGDWSQFDGIGSSAGEAGGSMLGVGYALLSDAIGGTDDAWVLSADYSYDADGWSLMAAVTTGEQTVGETMVGFDVQFGYWMNDTDQLYVGWDRLDMDNGTEDLDTLSIGVNHHMSDNTKLSFGLGYGLNDPATYVGAGHTSANGWTGAAVNDWNLTCQLQVAF
jgi:hypothetical protein